MPVIEDLVKRMRARGRTVPASLLASWKSGAAFLALAVVAIFYHHDPSAIVSYGKMGIAFIALIGWFTDAYYKRKHWELER
jgi:hypothetical protein